MTCDPLPTTGLEIGPLVLVALALLALGVVLVLARSRRRAGGLAATLVLALAGVGLVVALAPSAQAASTDCVTAAGGTLTITQTSTMVGLAPGVAPVAITGLVTNHGPDSTVVAAVDVAIVSVTRAPGRSGTCDASDYVLLATRMPVGQTLAAGASTTFTGAAIGFHDKPTLQDACQRATVRLLYTVVPGTS